MNLRPLVAVVVVALATTAHADPKDRAAIADTLTKLGTQATSLGAAAKASDDRGARKKFAPAANELGDDLAAIARRLGKDVPLKTIAKDAADADKAAATLVELADEAEDKAERKSLRGRAVLIQQGIAEARKSIDAAAAKDDAKPGAPAPAASPKFTGRLFNTSNGDNCGISENMKFAISRDGQQIYTSGLVFPGKDMQLVLEKGSYLVQLLDTTNTFKGQRQLDVTREGWQFKSGCVNND